MYGHCRTLRIKMKVKLLTYICSGDTPAEAFHTAAFGSFYTKRVFLCLRLI